MEKRNLKLDCECKLYVSKPGNNETWKVKTFHLAHQCHTSRKIKQCTYQFLASKVVHQIPSNPKIPPSAIKVQYEQEYELDISKTKAYRAKKAAKKAVEGDYARQYGELRDYFEELIRSNPGSTVKVLNEPCHEDAPTRIFMRCYVCLGPLKDGFKTLSRDLLGLDGAFMKEPARGQILSAVGVDSNNGIYPLAYAMIEAENYNSWSWFLECLGDDLNLTRMSNFTFISDRQKGLLQAVERMFPCAEHRFCLRHMHENMKSKSWRGLAYKQHLWKCAASTTVPQFEKNMLDLKAFDPSAWKYLADIPPQQWSRSHFTGKAVSDVLLSNMCEYFNRWIVDGRDKPIITCLEFIREYLMKRIDIVNKKIMKSEGLLTPKATKVFEGIKKEENKYTAVYNGSGMFQVNGPHNDQVVVDMSQETCACRKWELTVNGRNLWPKSTVKIPILPPLKIATAGRPKKSRRKGLHENDEIVSAGKLSKKGQVIQCGICKGFGHNRRGCTNGGVKVDQASGSKRKSMAKSKQVNRFTAKQEVNRFTAKQEVNMFTAKQEVITGPNEKKNKEYVSTWVNMCQFQVKSSNLIQQKKVEVLYIYNQHVSLTVNIM
ncbi:uncharacterized protein [Rutidosis leptorrhynchoides]|uniref:uncharacterized protein n=1 Tax=Rutidosis leptorrhynchoides TaxID=125765 RepID=UPI003A9925FB